jgi:two-component system chemotaxis response regulator CheY
MAKILVVDDSRTVRLQVRAALVPGGFEIIEAGDGVEGLQMVREHPDLALVILDVVMPRLGGLEMLAGLSRLRDGRPLNVVMLTTEAQPALVEKARAAGANGWMVKPFAPAMLLATIQKLLESARQASVSARSA